MKQTYVAGYGTSFSVRQLKPNKHFDNGFSITNAVRSQFDYDGYKKMPEDNPSIGMKVIEGWWR
jgi:hypothetical protein